MTVLQIGNYRDVFACRPFSLFWSGFSLSVLGDAMTRVALTWFVYQATGSPEAVGWLTFFYTAPVVVGGLVAGWLLDRFDRRAVMMIDSLFKGSVIVLVPLLHVNGLLEIWHVYVVAGFYGLFMMVPLAGTPALLPSLVPPRQLTTANALETLSYTLSGVIGPPAAGMLIAWIDAPMVLVLDAATYLAFAVLLAAVRPAKQDLSHGRASGGNLGLGDAFRLLLGNRILLSTTLMYMAVNIGGGALLVWLPIFADRVLGGGPELYGTLLGVIALGEIVSAVAVGAMAMPLTLGRMICLTLMAAGVALTLLLAGAGLPAAVAGLIIFGICHAPLTIWAQTLRMKIIPEVQRGRVFALLRMMMQSTNPLGGLMAGFAVPIMGLSAVIGLSAAAIGLPGFLGWRVRELREAR